MTLIYFIIILGVTLTVHEFGHFLFAKKSGIYCYEFSIGMGPKLHEWHRKGDETVYVLRLFPIGGYVSMAGEDVEVDEDVIDQVDEANEEAYDELDVDTQDDVEGGIIKEALKTLLVGGLVRMGAKVLKD